MVAGRHARATDFADGRIAEDPGIVAARVRSRAIDFARRRFARHAAMTGEVSFAIDLAAAVVATRHARRTTAVSAEDVTRTTRRAAHAIGAAARAVDEARRCIASAAGVRASGIARRLGVAAVDRRAVRSGVVDRRVPRGRRAVGDVELAIVDREHRCARRYGERQRGRRDREDERAGSTHDDRS